MKYYIGYIMKKIKPKASTRELISNTITEWNNRVIHDLESTRLQNASNLYSSVQKLLKSKNKIHSATITVSDLELIQFVKSYIDNTDYRIDIKSNNTADFERIQLLLNDFEYDLFNSIDKKSITLNNEKQLGLWIEELPYLDSSYRLVLNTGNANSPIINIKFTLNHY